MPGDETLKGGRQCPQCGSQLSNPYVGKNIQKTNPLQCPNCGKNIDGSESWINNPIELKPFNQNIGILAQVSYDSGGVMPTNHNVQNHTVPETLKRRRKRDPMLLSDENAENTDEEHLSNCQESAESLEIDR